MEPSTSQEAQPSMAPGWYPDPTRRYEFRYHNGVRWTADVSVDGQRYVEPAVAAAAPTGPPLAPSRGGRGVSITALVLGVSSASIAWLPFVFGLAVLGAVVGLVFGIVALRRRSAGRKMAAWGTCLSAVALPLCIVGFQFTKVVIDKLEDPGAHLTHITRCEWRDGLVAEGTIDNLSDVNHYYEITVAFEVGGGVIGSDTVMVDDVDPDTSAPFRAEASAPSGVTADVECTVQSVKNNLP